MDFISFMRDNGFTGAAEADAHYVVKFFDADGDGRLSYAEYL